jgi:Ni/Co efflux regulator RcnB
MKTPTASFTRLLYALIASALMAGAQHSLADNDKGHGKGQGKGKSAQRDDHGRDRRFDDNHRVMVREYYTEVDRGGRCPPGLAKKNNGCMPPGQAKKWSVGRPLPREVVYYELPPQLVVKIGVPPPGYKYVRVAGDILMIAVGTAMVVDAIQDLGRL